MVSTIIAKLVVVVRAISYITATIAVAALDRKRRSAANVSKSSDLTGI
jgi:hypothetical protein